MQRNFLPMLSILALLATGCSDKATEQSTAAVPASVEPVTAVSVTAAAPAAKTVLADVYKQVVAETAGGQLGDGRYVGYWNGQQFSSEGKDYFVAFTEATPPSEIEYPKAEDKVSISRATYELVGNQWQLESVQDDVGQFGGNNKAPAVDAVRQTTVYKSAQGKLFLATPSVVSADIGARFFSEEIFVFLPESGKWKYLGSVKAGSENAEGCFHKADAKGKTECASSKATVKFAEVGDSRWPELRVTLEGTGLDDDGNLAILSDKDSAAYRYDEKLSAYVRVGQ